MSGWRYQYVSCSQRKINEYFDKLSQKKWQKEGDGKDKIILSTSFENFVRQNPGLFVQSSTFGPDVIVIRTIFKK